MTRTFRNVTLAALVSVTAASYFLVGALGVPAAPQAPQHVETAMRPQHALAGSDRLSSTERDPEDNGGRWALRLYRTAVGDTCVQDGQLRGDQLGRQLQGEFVPRRLEDTGVCAPVDAPSWASTTRYPDDPRTSGHEAPRTVIFGMVESGAAQTVVLEIEGRTKTVEVRPDGTFIWVVAGSPANRSIKITVPRRWGGRETFLL